MSERNDLAIVARDAGIGQSRGEALQEIYSPFMGEVRELLALAGSIAVTDETDVVNMRLAHETRLALKRVRVDVEKRRKSLKEESLREGKAIDGMANVIKYLIVPVEEHLQGQEDFVRIAEEKRMKILDDKRRAELTAYGMDCEHMALGNMADSSYAAILDAAKIAHYSRIREAEEQIAREAAEEQARAEAAAKAKAEEAARIEAERQARAEADAKREAETKELRERMLQENARRNAEAKAMREKMEAEKAKREAEFAAICEANAKRNAEAERERQAAMTAKATCPRCGCVFDAAKTV